MGDDAPLLMFFYGTLKRGQANHDSYCQGALGVEAATARGALYDLFLGYPALVVPEGSIQAVGTADPSRDAALQRRLGRAGAHPARGSRVFGELFAFDDPEKRLPALDRLEGFDPEDASGAYRRVLLPVETGRETVVLAWAYVVGSASGVHLPGGRWPP